MQADSCVVATLAKYHLVHGNKDACEEYCMALQHVNNLSTEAAALFADVLYAKQDYGVATSQYQAQLRVLVRVCGKLTNFQANPNDYTALARLVKLLRRAGRLCEVPYFLSLARLKDPRALSHPGYNFCAGLYSRYNNDLVDVCSVTLNRTGRVE